MLAFVKTFSIIGLGGIGGWFTPPLLRFLDAKGFGGEILLADGDVFSFDNLSRQWADLSDVGRSKAEAMASRMLQSFPSLRIRAFHEFVLSGNVVRVVPENSCAIVAVDNHPARALIARHAAALRDVCVLTAGNEKYDGNVHVSMRRAGKDLTMPLLERHPEIAKFRTGDRAQMGCEELAQAGEPQLLVTNFLAATALLCTFHTLWDDARTRGHAARANGLLQEVYFDVREHAMTAIHTPFERSVRPKGVIPAASATV